MSDVPEAKKADAAPRTDDVAAVRRLHGLDRSGMAEDGWAEVPDDLIGGDPALEHDGRSPGPRGALNGDEAMDAATGAAAAHDPSRDGAQESEPPRFDLDAERA
ncbi:MAG TPA: hypothetical protein VG841_14780 [Caulobacterales bacterium]|nr:hypothetical protein [Caulobacterales bacterium]